MLKMLTMIKMKRKKKARMKIKINVLKTTNNHPCSRLKSTKTNTNSRTAFLQIFDYFNLNFYAISLNFSFGL